MIGPPRTRDNVSGTPFLQNYLEDSWLAVDPQFLIRPAFELTADRLVPGPLDKQHGNKGTTEEDERTANDSREVTYVMRVRVRP